MSALCQTGNRDGKSWNFPSYLYQGEIQPDEQLSLEQEQQENSEKQDVEEDGMFEYDSPSDNYI